MPVMRKYQEPLKYKKFIDFLKSRAQANFRKEPWELSEQQFFRIWSDERYLRKGRGSIDLCMTRIDPDDSWREGNIAVLNRRLQIQIRNKRKWNYPCEHLFKDAEYIF